VLLVDVDRDGNADLVTDDGISLVVFLSDGNEGFSPPELFDNGTALGVNDIAHGDIDDDGLPDVVVAGRTGLTTFFNFAGIFVPSFTQDVGDAASLALGELDDEGFLDAVVMLQDGTAVILSGAGDGSFQVTQTHTVRQGDGRYSIALGDIQGNGDLDLVVADLEGQLHLLSNQGRGVFNPPVTQPGVARGRAPLFGHLDGDGLLDLAVSTISGNGCADLIRLYHGRDDGTLAVGEGVLPHADSGGSKGRRGGIEAAALADFNGDGILDLVVGTAFDGPREQPGRVAILAGLGNGTFGPATYTTPGVFENWFAAGDIDGDGDLDLAMGKGPGGVSVLINCTVP
jgi:hypothetical protein